MKKNDNMVKKNTNVDFREDKSLRSYMPNTKFEKNNFYIEDNGSKYGTLVLI